MRPRCASRRVDEAFRRALSLTRISMRDMIDDTAPPGRPRAERQRANPGLHLRQARTSPARPHALGRAYSAFAIMAVLVGGATTVRAQPAAASAEQLFRDGKRL